MDPIEQKNLDIYGHAPLPWARARELLEGTTDTVGHGSSSWFLQTVGPDGRPHAAAVGALWMDDTLYFTSGPRTRKSRHIAKNENVAISVRSGSARPAGATFAIPKSRTLIWPAGVILMLAGFRSR